MTIEVVVSAKDSILRVGPDASIKWSLRVSYFSKYRLIAEAYVERHEYRLACTELGVAGLRTLRSPKLVERSHRNLLSGGDSGMGPIKRRYKP